MLGPPGYRTVPGRSPHVKVVLKDGAAVGVVREVRDGFVIGMTPVRGGYNQRRPLPNLNEALWAIAEMRGDYEIED
jgi:hypothetical protein